MNSFKFPKKDARHTQSNQKNKNRSRHCDKQSTATAPAQFTNNNRFEPQSISFQKVSVRSVYVANGGISFWLDLIEQDKTAQSTFLSNQSTAPWTHVLVWHEWHQLCHNFSLTGTLPHSHCSALVTIRSAIIWIKQAGNSAFDIEEKSGTSTVCQWIPSAPLRDFW